MYRALKAALATDCGLLERLGVMDYSLLLGVHFMRWGDEHWVPPGAPEWPAAGDWGGGGGGGGGSGAETATLPPPQQPGSAGGGQGSSAPPTPLSPTALGASPLPGEWARRGSITEGRSLAEMLAGSSLSDGDPATMQARGAAQLAQQPRVCLVRGRTRPPAHAVRLCSLCCRQLRD